MEEEKSKTPIDTTPIVIPLTIDGARILLQELTITELFILAEIHQQASKDQHREAHFSTVHLQNRYGMTRPTVFRATKKLEDLDLIVKVTNKDSQKSHWKYNIFLTEKAEAYFLQKGQEPTPAEKPAEQPAKRPNKPTNWIQSEQNKGSFDAEEFLQANLENTKRKDRESRTEPSEQNTELQETPASKQKTEYITESERLAQTVDEQSKADREHQERIRAQREDAEREEKEIERRQIEEEEQDAEEREQKFQDRKASLIAKLSKPREEPPNTNTNIIN